MSFIDQYAPPRRRYLISELEHLSRTELVNLVMQEPLKWPKDVKGTFSKYKTNMPDMRWALSTCEFTTDWPLPMPSSSSAHPKDLFPTEALIQPSTGIQMNTDTESNPISPPSVPNTQAPLASTEDRLTSTVPGSMVINAPLLPDGSSRVRSLVLLITDTRNIFNIEKASQQISVPVVSLDGCKPGECRVDAKEVVAGLQASICAFQGSARLGTPNEDDPEYIKLFGTVRNGELELSDDNVHLLVPANGKLNFRIARLEIPKQEVEVNPPPSRSKWVELQDHIKQQARLSPSPAATKVRRTPQPLTTAEENWLTDRATEMDGYTTFLQNQNRRLDNRERVKHWNFAAQFSEKYFAKNWPPDIARPERKTIRKQDIETILRMKTTALAQAINMSRILGIYYAGPVKSGAVVKAVEGGIDSSEIVGSGSDALAKFLVKWEKDHPGGPA
ncbi:hypothetical protein R3P38DRAFT_3440887 [Favolaschia claudopus]|uniref:Uncharacterized protein n=1 Tax=Favolaschia claudopus TaxID=2862362 RepID=A0AAW0CWH6_9AGAR